MTQLTILFADIAGSTALYEKLGDSLAEALVSEVLESLSTIVKEQKGVVIKTIGDEIMCQFQSSSEAIEAANRMHEYTEKQVFDGYDQKVAVRIAAHIGNVIHSDGDLYGDTVNVSARIAAVARPGKTVISEQTYNTLPENLQQFCRNKTPAYLKGKDHPINVYDVVWERNDQLTRLVQTAKPQPVKNELTLKYNGKHIKLAGSSLKIGRGYDCDLVVEAPQASRYHCEIRLHGNNKFSLVDNSTNGTYVLQNDVELLFHNETVPLHNFGILSLGQKTKNNNDHIIQYFIQPA